MTDLFAQTTYSIRRKVLKLVGGAFHVLDASGNVIGYSKMKAFTLREDIRVYTGEDQSTELLTIAARQIIDFSAAYDVRDARTGMKIGALKRKGLKSMLRDHWIVMGPNDEELGEIIEDSQGLAIVRRLLGELGSLIAPQQYHFEVRGRTVATGKQNRNPFVYKIAMDFSQDPEDVLDRRLGLAAGLLMAAVETKQG